MSTGTSKTLYIIFDIFLFLNMYIFCEYMNFLVFNMFSVFYIIPQIEQCFQLISYEQRKNTFGYLSICTDREQ